jgi:RimJ/RimL family protein N-acetyltransferase
VKLPSDTLATARLTLRRFTWQDLDLFLELYGDPEVMRYVGGVKTRAEIEAAMQTRVLDYYDQFPGLGMWATIERETGACIGTHLLNHIQGEAHIQVGYLLLSRFWGRGYATEMTIALLRYGFTTLALPEIDAITDRPNLASQHVLLKAGLERKGERFFAHPSYAASGALAWFEADAQRWLSAHPL